VIRVLRILPILCVLFTSGLALAVPGYEPFPEARRVPLRPCPTPTGSWQTRVATCASWRVTRAEAASSELFIPSGDVTYTLHRNDVLKLRFTYPAQGSAAGGFDVWLGDLNGDRLEDVIIAEHSGGNGLAGLIDTLSIVLSSRSGYRVSSLFTFAFSPVDVLRWRGQTLVTSTQFIGGANWEGRLADGRQHSYWVSTFLRVQASTLTVTWRPAPVWIRYTNKPNRTPESKARVSQRQRERLWRAQAEGLFVLRPR
jgi:hypothetical protein